MLGVKLKTNDNNQVGFVCLHCMTPEIGASASPRRHHQGDSRDFYKLSRHRIVSNPQFAPPTQHARLPAAQYRLFAVALARRRLRPLAERRAGPDLLTRALWSRCGTVVERRGSIRWLSTAMCFRVRMRLSCRPARLMRRRKTASAASVARKPAPAVPTFSFGHTISGHGPSWWWTARSHCPRLCVKT